MFSPNQLSNVVCLQYRNKQILFQTPSLLHVTYYVTSVLPTADQNIYETMLPVNLKILCQFCIECISIINNTEFLKFEKITQREYLYSQRHKCYLLCQLFVTYCGEPMYFKVPETLFPIHLYILCKFCFFSVHISITHNNELSNFV